MPQLSLPQGVGVRDDLDMQAQYASSRRFQEAMLCATNFNDWTKTKVSFPDRIRMMQFLVIEAHRRNPQKWGKSACRALLSEIKASFEVAHARGEAHNAVNAIMRRLQGLRLFE